MASRLLALPAKLRKQIYAFVFLHFSPKGGVDVFEAAKHIPKVALTRVNRQLRRETLSLYRNATAQYWATHHLKVSSIDCTSADKRYHENDILSEVRKLRQESGRCMLIGAIEFSSKTAKVAPGTSAMPRKVVAMVKVMPDRAVAAWCVNFENEGRYSGVNYHAGMRLSAWCDQNYPKGVEEIAEFTDCRVVVLDFRKCLQAFLSVF